MNFLSGKPNINSNPIEFERIETKYRNFYAPSFKVVIEGEDLVKKGMEIASVNVNNSLNSAGQFSFTVNNVFDAVKKELKWFNNEILPGRKVEVWMGYTDKLELMIEGIITSVRVSFPPGGSPQLDITGLDYLDILMKNTEPFNWIKKTHSGVVKDIFTRIFQGKGIAMEVEDTGEEYPVVIKDKQSDFNFISDLAKENHFEFFMLGRTIYFRQPPKNTDSVVTLEWGRNLISYNTEVNISNQAGGVKVYGWDDKGHSYTAMAENVDPNQKTRGAKTGSDMAKEAYGNNALLCVHRKVNSQRDADEKAKKLLEERNKKFVSGNGESIGIPEIRAGTYINIKGLGERLSRKYYVSSANHTVSSSGYKTSFQVEVNTI